MATHSSILAWIIPRTEEPGEPQSMGGKESNMTKLVHMCTCMCMRACACTHTHTHTHTEPYDTEAEICSPRSWTKIR